MDYEFVEPNSPRWLSLEDLPNEEWQYIHELDNKYLVSNYGRFKSIKKDNMRDRRNENKYVVSNENREKISQLFSKPIKRYSLNGELIKTWKSANEASLKLHIDSSGIRKCCRGVHKQTGGFMWRNIDAPDKISKYYRCKPKYNHRRKKVVQFDKNMNYLKLWSSVDDACKQLCVKNNGNLYRVLAGERKTLKGYKWKYYEEVKDELEI